MTGDTYANDADAVGQTVARALAANDSRQAVVGPLVWRPVDGLSARLWLFSVMSAGKDGLLRCDQIVANTKDDGFRLRSALKMNLLINHRPVLVWDTDDELHMFRLCERLWPSEWATRLRKLHEAELAGPKEWSGER